MNFIKRLGDEFLLFLAGIRSFLFEETLEGWFVRIILFSASVMIMILLTQLHNCLGIEKTSKMLRMKSCEKIGMAYVKDSENSVVCLDKGGKVVVIELNRAEYKTGAKVYKPEEN